MELNNISIKERGQPSENERSLYRYVSFDKLLDFLANGRIAFSRLDTFEDKQEGVSIFNLATRILGDKITEKTGEEWMGKVAYGLLNLVPNKKNSIAVQVNKFRKESYASCWYSNNHESVAMWKLYSKHDSVAIKIPRKKLKEILDNNLFSVSSSYVQSILHGEVKYFRFNDSNDFSDVLTDPENFQGFIKDKSFEHEREYRIVLSMNYEEDLPQKGRIADIISKEKKETEMERKIIQLEFTSFSELPFEIIFHPQSENWHRQNVQKLISKFNLNFNLSESKLKHFFV